MQTHYQRTLPHILPPGDTIFITYRLADSIPADVLLRLLEEKQTAIRQTIEGNADAVVKRKAQYDQNKRYFAALDVYLDNADSGPDWLKHPAVAAIIKESLHHRDSSDYDLQAYCVMSNHVHLLLTIRYGHRPFHHTLKSLKGYSARRANEFLNRTGQPFWQPESYDHVVRNAQELSRIVSYIVHNPVKAGLVTTWEEWPHTYLATDL